jgi:hypothetical protein
VIYVYAVGGRDVGPMGEPQTGVGSSPAPVRRITHGALAAIVSDVPAEWRAAGRADLAIHDRVIASLLGETIVPMRFGVVMGDDDEVCEALLARHADQLEALLAHVEGRVQMSVKAYYRDDDALVRAAVERRPELKRPARDQLELGRQVAAAVEEQRLLDEQALVAALTPAADDIAVDPGRSERHLCTVQLLVAQERRAELDAAVERAAAGHLVLRYVGPLAPYSFCALEVGAWA